MMIASGEQRCARRGAQGSGVEARVAQAHLREAIEIRRRHLAAERAPLTKARVVDQDEEHVRSAGRSFGQLDRPGLESSYVRTIFASVKSCSGLGSAFGLPFE